jgi:hypothetical protein
MPFRKTRDIFNAEGFHNREIDIGILIGYAKKAEERRSAEAFGFSGIMRISWEKNSS